MNIFDSLTHITKDGTWLGERRHDASLAHLLDSMDGAGVKRACLVAIADYVDNDVVIEAAQRHPDRLVPIAGLNPKRLPTLRRVDAVVAEIAQQGFAGIKLHPRLNGYDPLDPKCVAVFDAAAKHGLVVMLDTLFRHRGLATRNVPDTIDWLVNACPETSIILLHAGGSSMLDLWEIVRANPHLIIDFSFTIMRYAGSRLDADMRYFFETCDRICSVGSDFPEYSCAEVLARFAHLTRDLPAPRVENILFRNLEGMFARHLAQAAADRGQRD